LTLIGFVGIEKWIVFEMFVFMVPLSFNLLLILKYLKIIVMKVIILDWRWLWLSWRVLWWLWCF